LKYTFKDACMFKLQLHYLDRMKYW